MNKNAYIYLKIMKNELFEKIFDMYFLLCYYKKEQWIGLLVHLFFKILK